MNKSQEQHLLRIKTKFLELVDPKYRKGAKEHQTILHELPTQQIADFSIEEAIDQFVYLITLKDKITEQDKYIKRLEEDNDRLRDELEQELKYDGTDRFA